MRLHRGLAVGLFCLFAGCTDGASGDGPEPPPSIEDAVTDSAALALVNGHFDIHIPPLRYSTLASIDSIQAREYAKMYLAQFWDGQPGGLSSSWKAEHGTALQLANVAPCGPVRLGTSAVVADVDDLPSGSRRVTGEYWLVHFCDGSETAGFVGVSPYSTDVVIASGQLSWPPLGGAQFQSNGLPARFEEAVRYTPEAAALLAKQCTGQRIRKAPRLVLQYGQHGYAGKWELVLEARATVYVGITAVSLDTAYAGFSFVGPSYAGHEGLARASASQPSTISLTIIDNIPPDSASVPPDWAPHFSDVALDRDPGIPVSFDSIPCRSH